MDQVKTRKAAKSYKEVDAANVTTQSSPSPSTLSYNCNNIPLNPNQKIQELENTLKVFRAEFDLRMSIIQQILATRQEQFTVQKKLVEREETLYENLMRHWAQAPELALNGLSIHFDASTVVDNNEGCNSNFGDVQDSNVSWSPGTRRRSNRRKRMKRSQANESTNSYNEDNPLGLGDSFNIADEEMDVKSPPGGSSDEFDKDPLYCPEEHEQNEQQPKQKREPRLDYAKDREFASEAEARQFVREEQMWRLKGSREMCDGKKVSYDCKYNRKCRAKIFILHEHSTTGATLLYRTLSHHTHEPRRKHGLPSMIKEKIQTLLELKITRRQTILRKIREAGLPEPTLQQLGNFLAAERRRLLGIKYWPRNPNEMSQGKSFGFGKGKRGRPRQNTGSPDPFLQAVGIETVPGTSVENPKDTPISILPDEGDLHPNDQVP